MPVLGGRSSTSSVKGTPRALSSIRRRLTTSIPCMPVSKIPTKLRDSPARAQLVLSEVVVPAVQSHAPFQLSQERQVLRSLGLHRVTARARSTSGRLSGA